MSGRALVIFHNARGAALFVLDRPPAQSGARRGADNGPAGRSRWGVAVGSGMGGGRGMEVRQAV